MTHTTLLKHLLTLATLWMLLAGSAWGQAPGWAGSVAASPTASNGASEVLSVAADASGNVFVTGKFTGQVYFGSTPLISRGGDDLFVAKYVLASGTWAWAVQGGGNNNDLGYGIAVRGNSVYVTGSIFNTATNAYGVLFGGSGAAAGTVPVSGASSGFDFDLVLAKYTDNGNTATLSWVQVAGGTARDFGLAVAVSGSSIYVTGQVTNTTSNANAVVFGGNGSTAGTRPQYGASPAASGDIVLAKYTDNGSSATVAWTQVGGGTGDDFALGVAAAGTSVYVTGQLVNSAGNSNGVLFGGAGATAGTVQVNGASATSSGDVVLAKYTDQGSSALLGWTQVGGGTRDDYGASVAVSGLSVYVAGTFTNNASNGNGVLFGGGGTTAGTVPVRGASASSTNDVLLAKYTDQGTSALLGWTQVGGGSDYDAGYGVAVSGSSVYVGGTTTSNASNSTGVVFGGTGTTAGTVPVTGVSATNSDDLLLAKYTDNGPTATLGWAQVGGGTRSDWSSGVALSGQSVLAAGYTVPAARFGSYVVTGTANLATAVLARAVDTSLTPLAVQPARTGSAPLLYPNPAHGRTTVSGLPAGTGVAVYDALGRPVATATMGHDGIAALLLPSSLAAGVYVVRGGGQAVRLAVE